MTGLSLGKTYHSPYLNSSDSQVGTTLAYLQKNLRFIQPMRHILIIGLLACLCSCKLTVEPVAKQVHARGGVYAATISQDGTISLVASVMHPAGLWDITNNALRFVWKHQKEQPIVKTSISPDSLFALTADKNGLVVWDVRLGHSIVFWQTDHEITAIDLSKKGRFALVGLKNNTAELIDLANGKTIQRYYHTDKIKSVSLSPDLQFALTGSADQTTKLWATLSGKLIKTIPHKNKVSIVKFSPKGTYAISAASQAETYIIRINDAKILYRLAGHNRSISSAVFSPSERYLAIATVPNGISVWDIKQTKRIRRWILPRPSFFRPSSDIVYALAFSPDEKYIFSEDSRGMGYRWDFAL